MFLVHSSLWPPELRVHADPHRSCRNTVGIAIWLVANHVQPCVAIKAAESRLRLKYEFPTLHLKHAYEVRPRKDHRGVDLISDVLPFGALWYAEPNAVSNAISYAMFRSRSHNAVIRVCDEADNVIETREHAGDFREW